MRGGAHLSAGSSRKVVIACGVLEPELALLLPGLEKEVEVRYVEQALHRRPKLLRGRLQTEIDRAAAAASSIVLGYGLCSCAIEGLLAPQQGLVIPRCHDCISLLLGSPKLYLELFRKHPGTYYLTAGWIESGNDPIGLIEEHHLRLGREAAERLVAEEFKHYTHLALIKTGAGDRILLAERARKNAAILGKDFIEIEGSLAYLRELLGGPYPTERFLFVPPGQRVGAGVFF